MGRPSHADGRQTRQAILDAALDLFAEKGYFGTSLRDIATAVGVRESALYNYFPSKDALFDVLFVAAREQKLEPLIELVEAPIPDVGQALEELATVWLDSFSAPRQRLLFRVLMTDGMRLAKEGRINLFERMSRSQDRLRQLMRRLIREGWLARADVDLLVMEFVGPLVLWRQLHALRAAVPSARHRAAFARGHVEQFLGGASPARRRSVGRGIRRGATDGSRAGARPARATGSPKKRDRG
jgi:AcrR family transcriptional regulator